ncbi:alpha-N-acetylglucosaminidase isoform X2 [Silene latifolia]|uniref:alpha-N-acetylglucosaminidase isoform X2 n=1 Tax=Silene latifolia TaxID=37657 RepID=UPI003D786C22
MSLSQTLMFVILISLRLNPLSCNSDQPQYSDELRGLINLLDSQKSSATVQENAIQGLLHRLLPSHSSSFLFKIIPKNVCGGQSCFWIENYNKSTLKGPQIVIKGTTAVEVASGLHWYLKYFCGAHISWEKTGGVQIGSIPKPGFLPVLKEEGLVFKRPVPWNYYQNVVTSSYSYVWWDWERWEKEIDWMALQGINLPLAFTGQEAIWQKVFVDFGVSKEDLNGFFGGPAFLAWARMGNLHGWGGPLSQNWLDQQLALQKQILNRMLELGMTPVLPSFSGNVPAALRKVYPSSNITRLGNWNTVSGDSRWCCTFLLDPSDSLFVKLGEAFIKKQIEEYGDVTDIYSCDTFNENTPPTHDPAYISSLGAAVYEAMTKGDKHAVWLMQGWLFYSDSKFWKPPQMEALLHSVPNGKMIVLDLFADVKPVWKTSSQFYGTPYVWCMLHNFGGNIEMYGVLDSISSGPIDARISQNSTMIGVGMCMEGIEHNPVVYELMSEMAYRSEKVQPTEWIKVYSRRRYGKAIQQLETAWEILYHTIYNCTDGIADHNKDFIVELPDWDPTLDVARKHQEHNHLVFHRSLRGVLRKSETSLPKPHLWYPTEQVIKALSLFIDAGKHLSGSLPFSRYDLVDLTRQALSKLANEVYLKAVNAYQQKDLRALDDHSQKFLQLIKDIDELLGCDDNFLLGTWLESAKRLASNPQEMRQYEWNARTQITMWFDTSTTNQSKLHDYANKFWSGLLEDYYLPRAATYFEHLRKALSENEAFKLEGWRKEWISNSNEWQAATNPYPIMAQGDALSVATKLYEKYFSKELI